MGRVGSASLAPCDNISAIALFLTIGESIAPCVLTLSLILGFWMLVVQFASS